MIRNDMPLPFSWYGNDRSTIYNAGIYARARKKISTRSLYWYGGVFVKVTALSII